MKQRKIPMRTCVVTHEKYPKSELIRVVRTPQGEIIVDIKGKENGRGAYLKKDNEIIEKEKNSKILEKHLEIKIEESVYDELLKICD